MNKDNALQSSSTRSSQGHMGYVHSIETFGSVDGPGIRYIIFLQGCPMRCLFCHNPDTWKQNKVKPMTADELLDQAERYRTYWGEKGGITVSGGEALLQIDFLIELFEKAHARQINTCLDTSAQPFTRNDLWFTKFERLMKVTDTVLLDIKHIRDEEHRKLTKFTNHTSLIVPAIFLRFKSLFGYVTFLFRESLTTMNICTNLPLFSTRFITLSALISCLITP